MPQFVAPRPPGSLRWVLDVIDAAEAPGSAARERFAVVPRAARPKLLVPLSERRAAARSVRVRDYGVSRGERAARALLSLGLRLGVAEPLLRSRVTVGGALTEHLRGVVGRADVVTAIRVGRPRPNAKPLVTVLDRRGTVLAYAKLGWNPLTRGLLRREADMLAELAAHEERPRRFAVPRLLDLGRCGDVDVLVVSALRGSAWRPSDAVATLAALDEVAALGARSHAPLVASAHWRGQRERAAGAVPALAPLMDRVEDLSGDRLLAFGGGHGDWSPWNVARTQDGLAVWDWERAGSGRPAGLDAAHFDLQLAAARSSRGVLRALERTLASGGPLLSGLALPAPERRTLLALELVEMCLRYGEGRDDGPAPQLGAHLDALGVLLR